MENEKPVTKTITLGTKDSKLIIENEQPIKISQSNNEQPIKISQSNNEHSIQHDRMKTNTQNNNPKPIVTPADGLPFEMPSLFG